MRVWVRTSEPCKFRIHYDRKPEITSASAFVARMKAQARMKGQPLVAPHACHWPQTSIELIQPFHSPQPTQHLP
jgi:hypothetical protein